MHDTIFWVLIGLFFVVSIGTVGYLYYDFCATNKDVDCYWEKNDYIEEDEHLADIVKGFEDGPNTTHKHGVEYIKENK